MKRGLLTIKKKIYFASDFHLGAPDKTSSMLREKKIVRWLEEITPTASDIFLVGDVFDFWFEYGSVVPKGFIRLLGALAKVADSGVKLHIFSGNHDLWMKGYFPEQLGANLYHKPTEFTFDGKLFYLAHGDGLGPADYGYKLIKTIFRSKICQWLYTRLHPNLSFAVANFFSRTSRAATGRVEKYYLGDEKEWLVMYSQKLLQKKNYNYFIYGHRHFPLIKELGPENYYVNLGEWFNYYTYAVWDGEKIEILKYEG